jgi:dTDP-4-dehydrorhamnose 3,5-epimerase-like enzyme
MRCRETKLLGVFEIDLETHLDERGFFARARRRGAGFPLAAPWNPGRARMSNLLRG